MTKRQLFIGIPVIFLLANGVGYLLANRNRSPSPSSASSGASVPGSSSPNSAAGEGATRGNAAGGRASAEAQAAEDKKREETALARRAAGLAALEAGDYDKALIQFTEARALLGDKAHVAELLRVTQDLRSRPPSPPRTRLAANPSPLAAPTSAALNRGIFRGAAGGRRVLATKEDQSPGAASGGPGEAPPAGANPTGLLIVTTTPRGLLVQVDDSPVDLTPMRTRLRPGSHRVALLDGDRKVYETTVDVREGATATLLKDLGGAEPASEAPRSAASPPVSPVAAAAPSSLPPRPAAPSVAVPPPTEVAVSRPAGLVASAPLASPAASGESGILSITSPGLYGVVWINGRARGYPPLEVRNVPPGSVKVEVRVNGVEKRASTVLVRPGATTTVKLTPAESVQ